MNKQSLIQKAKAMLKSLVSLSKDYTTVDGKLIVVAGDEIVIGSDVTSVDEEGNTVPVEDGDYTLDSGIIVKVEGGKVIEMIEKEEEKVAEEMAVGEEVKVEPVVEEGGDEMAKIIERMDSLETAVMEILDMIKVMSESSTKMSNQIKMMGNQPAETKAKLEKTPKGSGSNKSILDEIMNKARKQIDSDKGND